ncbi:MAG TPA: hypothetical protein ENJ41_02640 [Oceanospirillales bacterium]|nr:hypothetical protein [Oceanospirillales bacterium]
MKILFKTAMQQHINSIELSDEQLERLDNLQKLEEVNSVSTTGNGKRRIYLGIVSLIMALVVSITILLNYVPQNRIIGQIADEVAKNHLKLKPLDIVSTQISDVQNYFTKLDFLPINSSQFPYKKESSLAGGRYCSIKGSSAAQLRYRNLNGEYITLYQANYSSLFAGLPDIDKGESAITTFARGVEITIWVEKGLVMVSAKNN